MEPGMPIAKGIVGTVTPMLGIIVSSASELETWLRIGSLCVGIAVGVATLVSIVIGRKKNE